MGGGSKSGGRAPRILLPPSGSLLMTSSPSWITASPPALGSDHRTARYPPSSGAPREGGFTPGEFSNGESGEPHSGNDTLTPEQRKEATIRRVRGATLQELANSYNVGISTIRRATRRMSSASRQRPLEASFREPRRAAWPQRHHGADNQRPRSRR